MKIKRWTVAWALTGIAALLGCSSSSSGSDGNAGCLEAQAATGGSGCYACIQSKCASQLTSYESVCSAYISCVCPSGMFSVTAAESAACEQDLSESACTSASQAGQDCQTANCATECGQSVVLDAG